MSTIGTVTDLASMVPTVELAGLEQAANMQHIDKEVKGERSAALPLAVLGHHPSVWQSNHTTSCGMPRQFNTAAKLCWTDTHLAGG